MEELRMMENWEQYDPNLQELFEQDEFIVTDIQVRGKVFVEVTGKKGKLSEFVLLMEFQGIAIAFGTNSVLGPFYVGFHMITMMMKYYLNPTK